MNDRVTIKSIPTNSISLKNVQDYKGIGMCYTKTVLLGMIVFRCDCEFPGTGASKREWQPDNMKKP